MGKPIGAAAAAHDVELHSSSDREAPTGRAGPPGATGGAPDHAVAQSAEGLLAGADVGGQARSGVVLRPMFKLRRGQRYSIERSSRGIQILRLAKTQRFGCD